MAKHSSPKAAAGSPVPRIWSKNAFGNLRNKKDDAQGQMRSDHLTLKLNASEYEIFVGLCGGLISIQLIFMKEIETTSQVRLDIFDTPDGP
jgi:hypothetical protein